MSIAAIIVAAGRGTRAGGDLPKQWQPLAGRRALDWTIAAFEAVGEIDRIVLVLHPDDLTRFAPRGRIEVVTGGATRGQSVRNGLEALDGQGVQTVLIHDVARTCTKPAFIRHVLDSLTTHTAVAPALPVTDALWRGVEGDVIGTQDRTGLYRAQTPQGFDFETIVAAHRACQGEPADDVEVARAAGVPVKILEGSEENLKITTAEDFARAERILRDQMDIRTGSGYDVHRFGAGDHVVLCGVAIPHARGLQGHSDADVGMHALTDALYGALAMGDIGQHFPPSDPQWKGAESHIFLAHAVSCVSEKGYRIRNVDVTLICEYPKIGPHARAMRSALSPLLGIGEDRISVKATTSEQLGFTGRGEGIAAMATATLLRPMKLAQLIATVCYVGHLRPAPGTWGSLVALPLAYALHALGGPLLFVIAIIVLFIQGLWATAQVTKGKVDHDPSEIVIDEVIGQWIALLPLSFGAWRAGVDILALWPGWIVAFLAFRAFDILKPGLVGRADRRNDALGVMLDDVIAGVFAAVVVLVLAAVAHGVVIG